MINQKNRRRIAGFAAALSVIAVPGLIKRLSQAPAQASNASTEEIISHMAGVICREFEKGTEPRSAGIRAGQSARTMGYSKKIKEVINSDEKESFEEQLLLAVDDQCSEMLYQATVKSNKSEG